MTNSSAETPGGERQRSGRPRRRGRRRGGGGGQESTSRNEDQQAQQERPRQRDDASGGRNASGGDRGGRSRRRSSRRPRPTDMGSGDVLRGATPKTVPAQPMRKRKIVEGDTSEPEFGCPMLTRTRLSLPFRGDQQVPRCSVGWAVHDEDEVLFCMNTPSRNLCWKENPEQLEALIEKLRPQIEAELDSDGSAAD